MKIRITSESELEELCRNLLHCSVNLRYWTKEWNSLGDTQAKIAMRRWEKKMDELLERIQMEKTVKSEYIKIER